MNHATRMATVGASQFSVIGRGRLGPEAPVIAMIVQLWQNSSLDVFFGRTRG
jgi:hypothetical protein